MKIMLIFILVFTSTYITKAIVISKIIEIMTVVNGNKPNANKNLNEASMSWFVSKKGELFITLILYFSVK